MRTMQTSAAFCLVMLALAGRCHAQQRQATAGEIDAMPFLLFSVMGNSLLSAGAQEAAKNAPDTLGKFFSDAQDFFAKNVYDAVDRMNQYAQQFSSDTQAAFAGQSNPGTQSGAGSSQPDNGAQAIKNICGLFNSYLLQPVVNAPITPSPAINSLLVGICTNTQNLTEAAPSIAAMPIRQGVAKYLTQVRAMPGAMSSRPAGVPATDSSTSSSSSGAPVVGGGQLLKDALSAVQQGVASAAAPVQQAGAAAAASGSGQGQLLNKFLQSAAAAAQQAQAQQAPAADAAAPKH